MNETSLFIIVYLLQVLVERVWEASSDEVGLSVVGKTLVVELAFKVLESESIVEDGGVATWWRVEVRCDGLALFDGSSGHETCGS